MPQKGFDLPLLVPQMHNTDFYGTFGRAVEHKGESLGPCHPIVQTSLQGFQESIDRQGLRWLRCPYGIKAKCWPGGAEDNWLSGWHAQQSTLRYTECLRV